MVGTSKPALSPEMLADKFNIGIKCAKQTLKVTTQKGIRKSLDVTDCFKTQLWRNKRVLQGKWYSDTMFFDATSIVQAESCAQVTTNGKDFTHFFPIQSKLQAFEGLLNLINEYGVPEHVITDGAKEEDGFQAWKTNWQKLIKRFYIRQGVIQPYCWWQNLAEREIGEIRKDIRKYTSQRNSPRRLWGFLGSYVAMKRSFTSQN